MELKIIIVIIIIIGLIIYNFITYKPVDSKIFGMGSPSLKSIILIIITISLFIYGLYLNEFPIYLNHI
jgi:hypothetical protein